MQYAVLILFYPFKPQQIFHQEGENKDSWLFLSKLPIFHMGFDV